MKAVELVRTRIVYSENAFAELVLWRVPNPVDRSLHQYKYRLAYVVNGVCVVRYDNEVGKGDHRHVGAREEEYAFTSLDALLADFERDVDNWRNA